MRLPPSGLSTRNMGEPHGERDGRMKPFCQQLLEHLLGLARVRLRHARAVATERLRARLQLDAERGRAARRREACGQLGREHVGELTLRQLAHQSRRSLPLLGWQQ